MRKLKCIDERKMGLRGIIKNLKNLIIKGKVNLEIVSKIYDKE